MKTARTGFYEIHGSHMEIILDALEESAVLAREKSDLFNKDTDRGRLWQREANMIGSLRQMLHDQAYQDEEAT